MMQPFPYRLATQKIFFPNSLNEGFHHFTCKEGSMTLDHREGFVEFQGRNIWFRMDGARNSGIPLLILHGGPGVPHDYLTPLSALSGDRPVILYDQLGCGNSDKPTDVSLYTLDYFTQELEAIRRALDLKEVHILGQSWGTMLAVHYILTMDPQGVRSLILSAPCLSASRWHDDQRRYINELPADVREIILTSEREGTCDTPEYQEAMMVFYRKHVCRMDSWPECLQKSMEKWLLMCMNICGVRVNIP